MFIERRILRHRIVLALLLIAMVSLNLAPLQAEGSSGGVEGCAYSSQLLDGQGFAVSGLGFAVSGLGFAVSGLGFAVSGLELTAEELAMEVVDNPVTPQWLLDRLADIQGGDGFVNTPVALLVVDDFGGNPEDMNPPAPEDSHGKKVVDVSNSLHTALTANIGDPNIRIVPVDVSDNSTNYRVDVIADRLGEVVQDLEAEGIHHFVFNFSFGVLPCADEIVLEDGTMVPWNFDEAVEAVNSMKEFKPVNNILECVSVNPDGTYTAHFGAENPNGSPVMIPVGDDNFMTGGGISQAKLDIQTPMYFARPNVVPGRPGRTDFYPNSAYQVHFFDGQLVWNLNGRTETASAWNLDQRCSPEPVPYPSIEEFPTEDSYIGSDLWYSYLDPDFVPPVRHRLECVVDNEDGTLTAHLGFESDFDSPVYLRFDSALSGGGIPFDVLHVVTPRYFGTPPDGVSPAFPNSAFQVTFSASEPLDWTLFGRILTVDANASRCVIPQGFSIAQYLIENYIEPEQFPEFLMKALNAVANDPANPLADLQAKLQHFYNRSVNEPEFAAIGVASAGNTRYLYFPENSSDPIPSAPPVSPASLPETIASSALLGPIVNPSAGPSPDNRDVLWRFSHDGNVATPGGGIELSPDNWLVGTSFSGPYTSMIAALWLTYEDACTYNYLNRPPVNLNSAGDWVNALFSDSSIEYPLTCSIPTGGPLDSQIDIRPKHYPNVINLNSAGKIAVAILGSPAFDATLVNPSSVLFGDATPVPETPVEPNFQIKDVNQDKVLDMVLHFNIQEIGVVPGDTSETLTGETFAGQAFAATDSIEVIPLQQPLLWRPSDGARVRAGSVKLTWKSVTEISCYSIQVHNAPFVSDDQTDVMERATIVREEEYRTSYLNSGTYYWRVQVGGTCDIPTGPWSEVGMFTVR